MSYCRTIFLLATILFAASVAAEVPVQVETVSNRAVIKQINVTGTVTSPRTAVLSTAVAGLVAELTVDGTPVTGSLVPLTRMSPQTRVRAIMG